MCKEGSNIIYPFTVRNKDGKPNIIINVRGGTKEFAPEEVSAMVLSKIKERAEIALNAKVTKAVITIPAHFNNDQRLATMTAGQITGLKILSIINEPTAAALVYELQSKYKDTTSKILVYDFGGGTFDVSIVEIKKGVVTVIASRGDPYTEWYQSSF